MAANQTVTGLGYTSLQYQQGGLGQSSLQPASSGGSGPTFVLDGITAPNFAYATFALSTAANLLPVIRVRDQVTANECDVFDDGTRDVSDASAISNLSPNTGQTTLGAWRSSGGVVVVTRFYNQGAFVGVAGNLNAAAANQPRLYDSGGTRITIGANNKITARSLNDIGNTTVQLTSGSVTDSDCCTGASDATYIFVGRTTAGSSAGNHVHTFWFAGQIGLFFPFGDGAYYYDHGNPSFARLSAILPNRDVASVYCGSRQGANMQFVRDGTVLNSRTDASSTVNTGSANFAMFTNGIDTYCPARLHWKDALSAGEIATVTSRLDPWT